jgi:hypothetical protein
VGRQGLEPWTYGLKELEGDQGSQIVECGVGQVVGHLAARANAALAALDAGDPFARDMLERVLGDMAEEVNRASSDGSRDVDSGSDLEAD